MAGTAAREVDHRRRQHQPLDVGEGGLGIPYSPGVEHPNTYNWAWREYGNRVGIWRFFDMFDELKLPAAHNTNSWLYQEAPQIFDAIRRRGDEIVELFEMCERDGVQITTDGRLCIVAREPINALADIAKGGR